MAPSPPILVIGAPRSGTSWLGAILDSHPQTLLRHEPDTIDRDPSYGFVADEMDCAAARGHLERLVDCRVLKAAGARPIFPKAYRSAAARGLRAGLIYGFKGAEHYLHRAFRHLRVPDLADRGRPRVVIKSVDLGRGPVWSHAWPEMPAVVIVRHPCGHVASVLEGQRKGHLPARHPLAFADTRYGRQYGISARFLEEQPPAIRTAWRWAVLNDRALELMRAPLVITYEELCADPVGVSRRVFAHCGLTWHAQSERFIAYSTSGTGDFFETRRDPKVAAARWRTRFDAAEPVMRAVRDTRAAGLFDLDADLHALAAGPSGGEPPAHAAAARQGDAPGGAPSAGRAFIDTAS
jgi:hypothetical protein